MANLFVKFRRELAPDYWALAWDGPGPTFRHELYKEYKEHRPAMPEELSAQLTPIEDLARCMGLPVIEKPGMEADDVMATLARVGSEAGHEVLLVTGDKDMLQVVGGTVAVLSPQSKGDDYARLDADGVRAKWGVPPDQIRDVLALMGDASDGYPGVRGVGEKTAVELLSQFGSVDAVYARIAEIKKPALVRKLTENKALAYLSRELATVRADLDLGLTLDQLAVAPIRRDELLAFAKRWEVRRLEQVANELGVADAEAGAPAPQRPADRRGTAAEQASPRAPGCHQGMGQAGSGADGSATVATVWTDRAPRVRREHDRATEAPLPASLLGNQGDLFAGASAEAGRRGPEPRGARRARARARGAAQHRRAPVSDGPRRGAQADRPGARRAPWHHCYVPLGRRRPERQPRPAARWFGSS
jgi:5'-3' exonuclease